MQSLNSPSGIVKAVPRTLASSGQRTSGGFIVYALAALSSGLVAAGLHLQGYAVLFIGSLLLVGTKRLTILGVVGLASPFMFYASIGITVNAGLVDIIGPFVIVLAISVLYRSKTNSYRLAAFAGYLIVFVGWILLAYLVISWMSAVPLVGSRLFSETAKLTWCLALGYGVYVLLRSTPLSSKGDLLETWSVMSVVTAAVSVVVFIANDASLVRITAGFEDPNLLGLYLVSSVGVVAVRQFALARTVVSWHTVVLVIGIVTTGSRGSLLAIGLFLVVYAIYSLLTAPLRGSHWPSPEPV